MIYIKELLPNPVGRDTEGEWIKVLNEGDGQVNLDGWVIKDESGKQFKINGKILKPKEETTFKYQETKIPLNNDGDIVTIYNPSGEAVHKLEFTNSYEGEIIISQPFKTELRTENLTTATLPINKDLVINNSASFTPLIIGFSLALILAIIAGFIFKKLL